MINLAVFFKNHFDTKSISDPNMQKFAEIHIQLTTENNPGGIYDAIILDTTTEYTNYFGSLTDKATQIALREAKTLTMRNALDEFKHFVSRQEGLIRSKWGEDSAEYQEFYPQGITEYSKATLANVEILMTRYKNAVDTHAADLGAPFVAEVTAIVNDFTTARQTQLNFKAIVESKRTETSTNRDGLESQLMKNLLLIASNNVGDMTKLEDYFDQSFIRPVKKDIKTGKLAASSTKNIVVRTFEPEDTVRIKNLSGANLIFGVGFTEESVIDEGVTVEVGHETIATASEFGDLNNKYLNVTNLSATHPGEYEIEFL